MSMPAPLQVAPASTASGPWIWAKERSNHGRDHPRDAGLAAELKPQSERGASMVEYGLLLALIAVIAIVAVKAFGQGVSTKFSTINASVAASARLE